jgi:hypothetical protein
MSNRRDELKSECENETARLQDLRYRATNLQIIANKFKNDENGEYAKVIKLFADTIKIIILRLWKIHSNRYETLR